jgi:hypothetical protein
MGDVCQRFGATPSQPVTGTILGISDGALKGDQPVHGLRHAPEGNTNGWYIWAGEHSADPDFFQPLHVEHLADTLPLIGPYLGLPPGWRFLIADGYEDVWEDPSLSRNGDGE